MLVDMTANAKLTGARHCYARPVERLVGPFRCSRSKVVWFRDV